MSTQVSGSGLLKSPQTQQRPVRGGSPRQEGWLSSRRVEGAACGKAILLGEHSVVYGKTALAVALPDLGLRVSLHEPLDTEKPGLTSWEEAFHISGVGGLAPLSEAQRSTLTQAFDRALKESRLGVSLQEFTPQPVHISLNFPLGAGLGGSAALCAAFVRLVDQIAVAKLGQEHGLAESAELGTKGDERFDAETRSQILRATSVDQIFHGTASGVDTATVVSGGLIACSGAAQVSPVVNGSRFFMALVDSGSRSETAAMVQKVRDRKASQPVYVDEKINRLGELAHAARFDLQDGLLQAVGQGMNEAHEHLTDLGLSTPHLDSIVRELRELGALGAKLTGSGGGGFAIGLFREYPEWVVSSFSQKGPIYVSEVSATTLSAKRQPALQ